MGGHPVVHFEVTVEDPTVLSDFYGKLFGWHAQSMPEMGYEMIDTHAGSGINGGFAKGDQSAQTVLFYVATDDLRATLAKVETLGGKVVVPITEIPNVVTFAQFVDPLGSHVGLVLDDGSQEGPGVSPGTNPEVGWFEIMTTDAKALWAFYTELFGWEIKGNDTGGMLYGEVDTKAGGRGINGGIGSNPNAPSMVSVYASVDDVQTYLDKAASLGGKALFGPMNVDEHLVVGMLQDPQGAHFGLFHSSH